MFDSLFGKYRFLVVSIALFLIFDLGVLVLNFYTSGKIAEQTELINLAGRQRTLTQQMSKATLYVKAQKLQLWVYQSGLDELKTHYATFEDTLHAFNKGGEVASTSTGLPVTIQAVSSVEGLAILEQANRLWAEFEQALAPMMVDTLITDEEIRPASAFIAANNIKMFTLMDDLTEFFKQSAERQTTLLRRAQVIGISLATINFFIILFHFLGQLRGRDREIALKQHESDQILGTIGEGVFLLDRDLIMSGQHSQQLQKIFASKHVAGRRLSRFLAQFLPKKIVKTAIDFVQLYFKQHVDPSLIDDINPLKRVEVVVPLASGKTQKKYLDFSFARLNLDAEDEAKVLVTVRDVTATIMLEAQDQQAADELNQQIALLTQILPIPNTDLGHFIEQSQRSYDVINGYLIDTKYVSDNFSKTLSRIQREVHGLKGNAAALNFGWLVEQLHSFEDNIDDLAEQGRVRCLSGRDLLPLTIKLKRAYDDLDTLRDMQQKLQAYTVARPTVSRLSEHDASELNSGCALGQPWSQLVDLTRRLAAEQGVKANLHLRGIELALPSKTTDRLHTIAVQLIRNSIAHGIETLESRARSNKPNVAELSLRISHDDAGNVRFVFEDDGRGFNYAKIRQKLVSKQIMSESEASALSDADLIRLALNDAISSRDTVDELAGRGVGLSLVWQQIKTLGGKLRIRSMPSQFTQFSIDFVCPELIELGDDSPTMLKAS